MTTAAEALRIAEQVTSEMGELKIGIGYFVGVELLRKTFTAVLEAEEETYRGRISDAAMVAAAHLTLNESYLITIRETLEVSSSGEEKPRYEVEKIEALNGRTFEQSPV